MLYLYMLAFGQIFACNNPSAVPVTLTEVAFVFCDKNDLL
jgi:hypothetical protein